MIKTQTHTTSKSDNVSKTGIILVRITQGPLLRHIGTKRKRKIRKPIVLQDMTTTKDLLKLKIEINQKVFEENAGRIKQNIDNLYQQYHALESSYTIIADTLRSELETVENHEVLTTKSLTLPTPVSATTGRKQQNSGNNQKEQTIPIIDLTDNPKERQRCNYCKRTFPDYASMRVHTRHEHKNNLGKTKKVNYFHRTKRNKLLAPYQYGNGFISSGFVKQQKKN